MASIPQKLLTSIIGMCLTVSIYCQNNEPVIAKNFRSSNGLINNHVLCTLQDSRGILWVGSYSGVQTFDGSNFNQFNINKHGENLFTNHVVLSMAEDKNHNMWFGTESGLNKYNVSTGEIEQFIYHEEDTAGLQDNFIKDIVVDPEGKIWLGTLGGGVIVYDEATHLFSQYKSRANDSTTLLSDLVNSLFIDNHGLLWVATENGGISVFDRYKRKVVRNFPKSSQGIPDNIINCVFQDYYGNYWFGTWNCGLVKYNPAQNTFKNFRVLPPTYKGKKPTIRWIEQTDKDFLWIGTYGDGLYKFHINTEKHYKVELSEKDNKNTKQDYIWRLYKDHKNNLWISTFGEGLFMVTPKQQTLPAYALHDKKDKSTISISCFLEDDNHQLWIGTYSSGIYIFNPKDKSFTPFKSDSRINNRINCLYLDSEKNIWAGTENGLFMLMPNRKTYRFYEHITGNSKSLSKANINTITEDDDGNIWIGTWGEGIDILSKEERKKHNPQKVEFKKLYFSKNKHPISNNNIWKLFKDSRGNIWIATSDKLTYFTPANKTFGSVELYSASSFYETEPGDIWVTSMGNGIYKLEKNFSIEKKICENDGLPSSALVGLMLDNKGRIWVGSNRGLSVVEPETKNILNFNKNNGLAFNEANIGAYAKLKSGKMVYGGNEGFNLFSPELLGMDAFDGSVYFKNIKVINNPNKAKLDTTFLQIPAFHDNDTVQLNYHNKSITIEFSAIDFLNPKGIKYAYRLEGFDKDWMIPSSINRQVTYTNLPPGAYVFRVKASYNTHNWSVKQAKLYINKQKPIWQQVWFKVCMAMLLMGLLLILFRMRLKSEKQKFMLQNNVLSNEKLMKEQKSLQLQNDALNKSLHENNKKMASLALKNLHVTDKLNLIYQHLKQMEKYNPNQDEWKLKQTMKIIEQEMDENLNNSDRFDNSVNLVFNDFQKRLSGTYPKLTHKDLRICAYIRMNKPNKEIAQQLNITISSLETSRYRIRKKLELDSSTNLNDFIIKF